MIACGKAPRSRYFLVGDKTFGKSQVAHGLPSVPLNRRWKNQFISSGQRFGLSSKNKNTRGKMKK